MSTTDTPENSFSIHRILQAVRDLELGEFDASLFQDSETKDHDVAQFVHSLKSIAYSISMRDHQLSLLRRIIPIGVALSAEKDFNRLLETVVIEAQAVTHADAGTLYLVQDDALKFVILRTTSLNLVMGGTSKEEIPYPPVLLHNPDGSENHANIASHVALTHKQIRVADAYQAEGFDFSGTKAFDHRTGYHSKSFLAMPLINTQGIVIGVLQLINAQDPKTGTVIEFTGDDELESLVLLASAALDGYIREETLRNEIAQLRIEIDQVRRARHVAEITDTTYFKELQSQATLLRSRRPKDSTR